MKNATGVVVIVVLLTACVFTRQRVFRRGSFDMMVGPTSGEYTFYGDDGVFRDDHLHAFGLDVPGQSRSRVRVVGQAPRDGATVAESFSALGDIESLPLTQAQIRDVIDGTVLNLEPGLTADESHTALALVTPGDAAPTADLSNLYVLGITRETRRRVVVFARKLRCTDTEERTGCEAAEDEVLSSRHHQVIGRARM